MDGARWRAAAVAGAVCLTITGMWPAVPHAGAGPALVTDAEAAAIAEPATTAASRRAATQVAEPAGAPSTPGLGAAPPPAEDATAPDAQPEDATPDAQPAAASTSDAEPAAAAAAATAGDSPTTPLRELTVAVTGDVLPHQPVMDAARTSEGSYDFVPLLRALAGPLGRADLALCHLEVPLSRDHHGLSSYPVFNAPPEVATALADVGYDGCSLASNHSFDQGVAGVRATLDVLDDAGLGHAGMARSRRESQRIRTYDVDGVRVAHLSYTYGLNGFTLPPGRQWLVNTIAVPRIRRDARRARRAGADVVLVSMHWGTEYVAQPTPEQRRLARRLLRDSHVDALIGHHAHVVQPVERVAGRVVVYGLGNLLSNQSAACCAAATQDGVLVELRLRGRPGERFQVDRVRYLPTMVRHPQRRVVLVDDLLERSDDPDLRRQLRASRQRTRRVIGDVARPWRATPDGWR